MKKYLPLLIICSALFQLQADANNSIPVIEPPPHRILWQKKTVKPIAKAPVIKAPTPQSIAKPLAPTKITDKNDIKKRFIDRISQENDELYNNLGFSAEQKTMAEKLDASTRLEKIKKIKSVQKEIRKLKDLEARKASKLTIFKQRMAVKSAKKKADKYMKKNRQLFEAILTKEQKTKLKEIETVKKQKNDSKNQ